MVSNIEYEVDVPDIEYQCQAGKPWLLAFTSLKKINHQEPLSTDERRSRWATTFSRKTRHWHNSK
jgi:hypothetical protein